MKKYIQITAGRGPVECARVCYLIFKEFYKSFNGLEILNIEEHNTELNCIMSVVMCKDFSDNEIEELNNKWIGTIQYISTKNSYRPNHKRKNWFVGINMIDPEELIDISEDDIFYDTMRSGGKGGQNINKVETAVRAKYLPTGLSVKCDIERSQSQNKKKAKELLMVKLAELNNQTKNKKNSEIWSNSISIERGNPIQIFKGNI